MAGFLLTDNEAVDKLLREFGNGYAVELPYVTDAQEPVAVWFVPGTVFVDGSQRRLIVGVQGRGVCEVSDPASLDAFILPGQGIPLRMAEHIERVVAALVAEVRRRRAANVETKIFRIRCFRIIIGNTVSATGFNRR